MVPGIDSIESCRAPEHDEEGDEHGVEQEHGAKEGRLQVIRATVGMWTVGLETEEDVGRSVAAEEPDEQGLCAELREPEQAVGGAASVMAGVERKTAGRVREAEYDPEHDVQRV